METIEQRKEREQRESEARKRERSSAKEKNLQAEISLRSGMANETIAEAFVRSKSSSGEERRTSRRILRDLRRFQTTGRISNFLANQITQDNTSKISSRKINSNDDPLVSVGSAVLFKTASQNLTSDLPKKEISSSQDCSLGLYVSNNNVWVSAGVVNNDLPIGFDPQDGKQVASGGSGYVYLEIPIEQGIVKSEDSSVSVGNEIPEYDDDEQIGYYGLGYFDYGDSESPQITNYGCGSVSAVACRNWFSEEAKYSVIVNR